MLVRSSEQVQIAGNEADGAFRAGGGAIASAFVAEAAPASLVPQLRPVRHLGEGTASVFGGGPPGDRLVLDRPAVFRVSIPPERKEPSCSDRGDLAVERRQLEHAIDRLPDARI